MPDRAHERAATFLVPLDEERAVIERLRRGEREALAILYGWYRDPVWRVILARLPEREAAEDCLRETFRTALEKIGQFVPGERSIYGWLRRIAVNKALDVHRARSRDRRLAQRVIHLDGPPPSSASPRPDRGLEVADTAHEVRLSLSRLNPRYARVLELRILQEQSREACAEALGVTVPQLDVLLHRACKAFRKVYPP